MPFNITSIKDKATSAKNATVTKFQDTRDRHTSTPMARTRFAEGGYVPDARKAPPPPPPPSVHTRNSGSYSSRVSAEEDHAHAPPPVLRSTKPSATPSASANASPPPPPGRVSSVLQRAKAFSGDPAPPLSSPRTRPESKHDAADIDAINWANLSAADKQVFFGWLDEFFARFVDGNRGTQPRGEEKSSERVLEHVVLPPAPPTSDATVVARAKGASPRPIVKSWSKPSSDTATSQSDFISSYPPPTTHGSRALDLAYYFHPSTQWDSTWYSERGGIPPPLQSDPHRLYKAQMMSRGDAREVHLAALFCDLSTAWVSVAFSASSSHVTERTARYLLAPEPLSRDALIVANEMYGEAVAAFAESFLGSRQFCARGECWDLASEALKSFSATPSIPPPVPSLGRTHGHLIFVGRAMAGGRQVGRWRGGDDRVRRGDIVEWRSVRIGLVGGPPGAYAILGDPEHTAIITRDAVPSASRVHDGASVAPRALRSLEVVEQSRNNPPEPLKRVYNLEAFEEGEIWIYRPVSMEVYLGFGELDCTPPPMAFSI